VTPPSGTKESSPPQSDVLVKLHERGLEQSENEARVVAALLGKHGLAAGGSILDAPCGMGHHAIHLVRMGYAVAGLDLSLQYVDRANALRTELGLQERLDLRLGDVRTVTKVFAGRTFDAALSLRQSLGHWDEEADVSVLRQLRDLTTANGLLLVDVLNRDNLVKHLTSFGLSRYEDGTEQHEMRRLNLETSHLELIWDFYHREGEDLRHRSTAKLRIRVYALHELRDLLRRAGWQPLEEFGSFQLEPVTVEKKRIIVLASKA
jgi:SAM-dependent methyltransferase